MLKDRRKPWQKTTHEKWARCGSMLACHARAFAKAPTRHGGDINREMAAYAAAMGFDGGTACTRVNAQIDRLAEAPPVIVRRLPAATERERLEDRKAGAKVLAKVRGAINARMAAHNVSTAAQGGAARAYADAMGITLVEALNRIDAQKKALEQSPPMIAKVLPAHATA